MIYNIFIQQIRGLSIIFVILYHFFKSAKTSGFLSVTVFLQISGYIITLTSKKNEFSTFIFYYKRFINIVPQLNVVLAVVIFITSNESVNQILNLYDDIVSVFKLQSNIYFYKKEVDYFSQYDNPSHILHLWYISLLQQIYFFYPILFFMYNRFNYLLLILCLISFTYFFYSIFINPSFAYYMLVCRIYEYILGIIANIKPLTYKFLCSCLSGNVIICVMILLQLISINIHVLAKFIIINCSTFYLIELLHSNLIGKDIIINNWILYSLGNISYELYLIHYPLIHLKPKGGILLIFDIYLLAYFLSFTKTIKKDILFIIAILVLVIMMKYIHNNRIILTNKYKNVIVAPQINPMKEYYIVLDVIKKYDPSKMKNRKCYILLGDSHLQQWFPSIIRIAKKKGYGLVHKYFHANDIEDRKYKNIFESLNIYNECIRIIISSFSTSKSYIKNITNFKYPFSCYINEASIISDNLYIIHDIPHLLSNPLNCVYSKKEKTFCYATLGINASLTMLPHISNSKTKYCNFNKYIYSNNKIMFVKNRIIVYKDTNHLTLSFSNTLTNYISKCLSD